jgi:F-type H+-transporting ATPase subunit a
VTEAQGKVAAEHGGGHGPLSQFEVTPIIPIHIGNLDLSFTNSALWMGIAVLAATALLVMGSANARLVPGRVQSMGEVLYEFIAGMVRDNVGSAGKQYFPFIFTLFVFILFGNLLGLLPVPGKFTFTSHIVVTFAMALVIFVAVTVIGFARHGLRFLKLFVPEGVPLPMLFLLVPIEILSYFIRPITLSVRLFANMVAGHTLLFIFAGFIVSLGSFFVLPGIIPLAFTTAFYLLEVLVAVLQAYVFTILTCIYLQDAIHLH